MQHQSSAPATAAAVPAEFAGLQAQRLRFWDLALEIGFAQHQDPVAAVDAAVAEMRGFDARIIAFAEESAAELKASAR